MQAAGHSGSATTARPAAGNAFIPAVLIVWALFLAVEALKFYFRRPPSEQDLARAVQRLQHR
jgi:hypothetical protein